MRESEIEKYLREKVKRLGGKAYKFVSPGTQGVPDRMVCLPGGELFFAELKAPGQAPRPSQLYQINLLRRMGQRVEVIDSKEQVDRLLGGGIQ